MSAHQTKPLIGITMGCRFHDERPTQVCTVSRNYIDAICKAGGVPILIPPHFEHAKLIADRLDGLLLTGGGDIQPAHYGQGDHHHEALHFLNPARDESEMFLLQFALKKQLPIFGVCRGAQMMNVALGGTLHQHLPDVLSGGHAECKHRQKPCLTQKHPVTILAGSRLAELLKMTEVETISWHHQAIDKLGENLLATAHADDGIVEAIEYPRYPSWFLGVQWHAEHVADTPEQQKLFDDFVKNARAFLC